jgi:hypothetical protein
MASCKAVATARGPLAENADNLGKRSSIDLDRLLEGL